MYKIAVIALLWAGVAMADEVPVPQSGIPKGSIITASALRMQEFDTVPNNVVRDASLLIGQQAKRSLASGRPILQNDITAPVLIKRNDTVSLIYSNGHILLSTTGRALGEGGIGSTIPVMNLSSRKTITGVVQSDGSIQANTQGNMQ